MARTCLPPGFRFHPTDVELVWYYLRRKNMGKPFRFQAIAVVELYKFAPWDLPSKSCLPSRDLEWYFFCPRDKKYTHGTRTNRTTETGFWKATGKDRSIIHKSKTVGKKRTLIFHLGKAPHGTRTDWVMYEFRLESEELANAGCTQDAYVLCKIFEKSGAGPRNGEQYGAPFNEEEWEDDAKINFSGFFAPVVDSVAPDAVCPFSNFEVGEPSSGRKLRPMQITSEAGIIKPSENGELSIQSHKEVELQNSGSGDLFQVGNLSNVNEPCADGFSLDQLETYLLSYPPCPNMVESGIHLDDLMQELNSDYVDVFGNLGDLSTQPIPEQYSGIMLSNNSSFNQGFHNGFSEFVEEDCFRPSDFGFAGPVDDMNISTSYGFNDTGIANALDAYMATELQPRGSSAPFNQLPSSSQGYGLLFLKRTRGG